MGELWHASVEIGVGLGVYTEANLGGARAHERFKFGNRSLMGCEQRGEAAYTDLRLDLIWVANRNEERDIFKILK